MGLLLRFSKDALSTSFVFRAHSTIFNKVAPTPTLFFQQPSSLPMSKTLSLKACEVRERSGYFSSKRFMAGAASSMKCLLTPSLLTNRFATSPTMRPPW